MLRVTVFVAALMGLALLTGLGVAQPPPPPRPPDRPPAATPAPPADGTKPADTTSPTTAHKAKSVLGSKVSITGGLTIGTVDDIIFSDDGYIDYLVVLNEGKYVLVPWQAAKFDFDKR